MQEYSALSLISQLRHFLSLPLSSPLSEQDAFSVQSSSFRLAFQPEASTPLRRSQRIGHRGKRKGTESGGNDSDIEDEKKKADADNSGKRRRKSLQAIDRQRHNEAETERRRRMKMCYEELADACGFENPTHVQGIVSGAIEKINELTAELKELMESESGLVKVKEKQFEDLISGLLHSQPDPKKDADKFREYQRNAHYVINFILQMLKSEINFHTLFNNSMVAEAIVLVNGRIVDANIRVGDLLQYTRDELIQPDRTLCTFVAPDAIQTTILGLQDLQVNGSFLEFPTRLVGKQGEIISCKLTSWLVADGPQGKPMCIRIIVTPIGIDPLPSVVSSIASSIPSSVPSSIPSSVSSSMLPTPTQTDEFFS